MANVAKKKSGLFRLVKRLSPQAHLVLIVALAGGLGSLFVDNPGLSLGMLVLASCLGTLAISVKVMSMIFAWRQRSMVRTVSEFVENNTAPSFLADTAGAIGHSESRRARGKILANTGSGAAVVSHH